MGMFTNLLGAQAGVVAPDKHIDQISWQSALSISDRGRQQDRFIIIPQILQLMIDLFTQWRIFFSIF